MPAGPAAQRRRPLLFSEIRSRFLAEIRDGQVASGDRLPAEQELAESYGVSRPTMREVLRSLEADGLVRRVHGVGTFVSQTEPLVRTTLDLDIGVTEAVEAAHATLGIKLVRVARGLAPSWTVAPLELQARDHVVTVERIISANGKPAVHGLDVIPAALIEGRGAPAYQGGSIYQFLERECGIRLIGGVAEVTAVPASASLAEALDIPRASPLLRLDQIERSVDGHPVLFSREHYAPGLFSLTVRRLRQQRADHLADGRTHPDDPDFAGSAQSPGM